MNFSEDPYEFTRIYMVESDFELYHYKTKEELDVNLHHHDFYEVYFFLSGKVDYIIDGRTYHLKENDILIINSKEIHRPIIDPKEVYERIVIFIRPEFIMTRSREVNNLSMCFLQINANKHINLLKASDQLLALIKGNIVRIKEISKLGNFGSDLLKESYLTELLVYLNYLYLENIEGDYHVDVTCNKNIDQLIRYICMNLQGDLSLDVLADQLYISKYHLSRQFKRYTGLTLHRFIQYKRMLTAKDLLRKGTNVTTVCHECGFQDYSNFIRAFTREFGMSPKQYSLSSNKTNVIS